MSRRRVLELDETGRRARVDKTLALAKRVFGDRASALEWLDSPKRKLDGKTPLELLATAEGGQLVEEELVSIDEGYVT